MLLYCPFWMFMGFILHIYIIFGTNLLTRGPARIAVCLFRCFEEKEYQMESKQNETFGSVIFGMNVIQRTWSASQEAWEAARRQEGAPTPSGRAPYLVGRSKASWLALQAPRIMFAPKITLPKVSFRLDSVWYSFSSKYWNRPKNSNMGWASG